MEKEKRDAINDLLSKQTKAIENRLERIFEERYNAMDAQLKKGLTQQESFIAAQIKRYDASVKDIEKKVSEQRQKAVERAEKELLIRIDKMGDVVGLSQSFGHMQRLVDEYLEKTMILTEVSFYARSLDDQDPKIYQDLIRSMDFPHSWFQKRRGWTLETLYAVYKNGVEPDPEDSDA